METFLLSRQLFHAHSYYSRLTCSSSRFWDQLIRYLPRVLHVLRSQLLKLYLFMNWSLEAVHVGLCVPGSPAKTMIPADLAQLLSAVLPLLYHLLLKMVFIANALVKNNLFSSAHSSCRSHQRLIDILRDRYALFVSEVLLLKLEAHVGAPITRFERHLELLRLLRLEELHINLESFL